MLGRLRSEPRSGSARETAQLLFGEDSHNAPTQRWASKARIGPLIRKSAVLAALAAVVALVLAVGCRWSTPPQAAAAAAADAQQRGGEEIVLTGSGTGSDKFPLGDKKVQATPTATSPSTATQPVTVTHAKATPREPWTPDTPFRWLLNLLGLAVLPCCFYVICASQDVCGAPSVPGPALVVAKGAAPKVDEEQPADK